MKETSSRSNQPRASVLSYLRDAYLRNTIKRAANSQNWTHLVSCLHQRRDLLERRQKTPSNKIENQGLNTEHATDVTPNHSINDKTIVDNNNFVFHFGRRTKIFAHCKSTRPLKEQNAVSWSTSKAGSNLLHRVVPYNPPIDVLQALLDDSRDPSILLFQRNIFERTPLHEACRFHASRHVVETLLNSASKSTCNSLSLLHQRDYMGRCPLHYASDDGFGYQPLKLDVVWLLSVHAPEVLIMKDAQGQTPIDLLRSKPKTTHEVTSLLHYLEPMASAAAAQANTKIGVRPRCQV